MKEKDLFPPLKKYFKDQGYTVYAEVPVFYRGVDFVAVKGDDHIAVEMKLGFTKKVIQQATQNTISFARSYVAYPVKQAKSFKDDRSAESFNRCVSQGIGILQVFPHGTIFTALEAVPKTPYRVFDFSQYSEKDEDEAGLPFQKGVSAGYFELEAIKAYVLKNPKAKWREIYDNVQNHYSNYSSMAASMKCWRGFDLRTFKQENGLIEISVEPTLLKLFP